MAAPESKNYIRAFLRRTYTLTQLQALSLAIGASVITGDCSAVEVLLTNAGFEGGNAGGVVRGVDRLDIGAICEELISEMVQAGVTSWTAAQSSTDFRRATVTHSRAAVYGTF